MAVEHENLISIHPFAHVSSVDPGAIGANKGWIDTSTDPITFKLRNETDDGWVILDNSIKLLAVSDWILLDQGFVILFMPEGKNAIIDKIVFVALSDLDDSMSGITLDIIDMGTSFNILGSANLSGDWDAFGGTTGLDGAGDTVSFQGYYNFDEQKYYDFPVIAGDLEAQNSSTPFGIPYTVRVFVFGTYIDPIYP